MEGEGELLSYNMHCLSEKLIKGAEILRAIGGCGETGDECAGRGDGVVEHNDGARKGNFMEIKLAQLTRGPWV